MLRNPLITTPPADTPQPDRLHLMDVVIYLGDMIHLDPTHNIQRFIDIPSTPGVYCSGRVIDNFTYIDPPLVLHNLIDCTS